MKIPVYTKQFEKDIKKIKKRNKNLSKLKDVIVMIMESKKLPPKYREHKLTGNWSNRREKNYF